MRPRWVDVPQTATLRDLTLHGPLVLHCHEQMFDTLAMLSVHDVESIRRSAAMAPLSSDEAFRVLEACDQLLRERGRIAELLADLPASWTAVRKTLNELQSIVQLEAPSSSKGLVGGLASEERSNKRQTP